MFTVDVKQQCNNNNNPLLWILPLYLQVNQKSDDDDDDADDEFIMILFTNFKPWLFAESKIILIEFTFPALLWTGPIIFKIH